MQVLSLLKRRLDTSKNYSRYFKSTLMKTYHKLHYSIYVLFLVHSLYLYLSGLEDCPEDLFTQDGAKNGYILFLFRFYSCKGGCKWLVMVLKAQVLVLLLLPPVCE